MNFNMKQSSMYDRSTALSSRAFMLVFQLIDPGDLFKIAKNEQLNKIKCFLFLASKFDLQ